MITIWMGTDYSVYSGGPVLSLNLSDECLTSFFRTAVYDKHKLSTIVVPHAHRGCIAALFAGADWNKIYLVVNHALILHEAPIRASLRYFSPTAPTSSPVLSKAARVRQGAAGGLEGLGGLGGRHAARRSSSSSRLSLAAMRLRLYFSRFFHPGFGSLILVVVGMGVLVDSFASSSKKASICLTRVRGSSRHGSCDKKKAAQWAAFFLSCERFCYLSLFTAA